ncbi:MAG: hypothetical protein JW751_10125 [Polyangiaceae bacterium]|nr:hypothetical protein [Polyangiaceae bacterium]
MTAIVLAAARASLVMAVPACRCTEPPPAATSASAIPAEEIPAPPGVMAEIFIPHPEVAWGRMQPVIERALGFGLPNFAAVAVELFGIPAAYAPGVTLERPVTGVVVDATPPRFVMAWPLRSGRELVAALTTGREPTHRASEASDRTVTVLEPVTGTRANRPVIGVNGNHLLVGGRAEDLARFGPYVARALGRRVMPTGPIEIVVPRAVLRDIVSDRIGERWARERERLESLDRQSRAQRGGRSPDFGEPTATVAAMGEAVGYLQNLVRSSEEVRFTVDVGPDRVVIYGDVVPLAQGAARELMVSLPAGDARALLSLPTGVEAAVVWRSSPAARERHAASAVQGLERLFAERLASGDRALLAGAVRGVAKAIGDRTAVGVLSDGTSAALVIQVDAPEPPAFEAALRAVLRSTEVSAVAEPLTTFLGAPAVEVSQELLPGSTVSASRARFVFVPRRVPGTPAARRTYEMWWHGAAGRGHVAVGAAPGMALGRSVSADGMPEASLAADSRVAAAVERAGTQLTVAVLVEPRWVGLEAGGDPPRAAPLLLTLGRNEGRLRLRGEVDAAIVAGIVRRRMRKEVVP